MALRGYKLLPLAVFVLLMIAVSLSVNKIVMPPTRSINAPAASLNAASILTPTPAMTPTLRPAYSPTVGVSEGMHLILNEAFYGSGLNTDVWNSQFRWGTTNPPELQEYTPDALRVQPGNGIRLTANKNGSGQLPYSSGMLASYDHFYFQYGYIEIRAKVPQGKGLWPALWLLAQDPQSAEEIDLMELLGQDPHTVYTTLHYQLDNKDKGVKGASIHGPDFSQDFHIFAVDWEWDKIVWYVDGSEVFRVTDHIPHEPMYLIVNLAVGGLWPGAPDRDTPFPAHFDIDYIRVFTH
jgi:beta-glucanase (GH16 family)